VVCYRFTHTGVVIGYPVPGKKGPQGGGFPKPVGDCLISLLGLPEILGLGEKEKLFSQKREKRANKPELGLYETQAGELKHFGVKMGFKECLGVFLRPQGKFAGPTFFGLCFNPKGDNHRVWVIQGPDFSPGVIFPPGWPKKKTGSWGTPLGGIKPFVAAAARKCFLSANFFSETLCGGANSPQRFRQKVFLGLRNSCLGE